MAGGWEHVTNEDGTPYSGLPGGTPTYGAGDRLETGGDYIEALEQMYGMIWYLAYRHSGGQGRAGVLRLIEQARDGYRDGVMIGRELE